jgi:hypothetical protein
VVETMMAAAVLVEKSKNLSFSLPRQEKKVANFGRVPSRHHR